MDILIGQHLTKVKYLTDQNKKHVRERAMFDKAFSQGHFQGNFGID